MASGKTVAIFGGGIGGLTAAHELALRGFTVRVYEKRPLDEIGGKARTQYFAPDAIGRLPGEHGFRFFPRFYSLVRDTMARIPLDVAEAVRGPLDRAAGLSVLDHLVPVPVDGIGRRNQPLIPLRRRWSVSIDFLVDALEFYFDGLDVPLWDQLRIGRRLMRFFLSGDERRLGEFEHQSFWDFIEAAKLSANGQEMILNMPKVFVAMSAKEGNARTLGNVLFLLIRDMMREEKEADEILNGPTTEKWLLPWRRWLDKLGVKFSCGESFALEAFVCDEGARRIRGARLAHGEVVSADHYVLAVPLEVARRIVREDPRLRGVSQLDALASIRDDALGWMVGAQFYLQRNVETPPGHLGWADCTWALTGISQAQFWAPSSFRSLYGRGRIDGILSLNVSDWSRPGIAVKKPAAQCTRAEIYRELVTQAGALVDGERILEDRNVVAWRLDDDVAFDGPGPEARVTGNDSPLLIHPKGLWALRPEPAGEIENLFLAADYVRNDMDLATMEGANQAAREAVNAILERSGSRAPRCRVANHLAENEWGWLRMLKAQDDERYRRGKDSLLEAFEETVGLSRALERAMVTPREGWQELRALERAVRAPFK